MAVRGQTASSSEGGQLSYGVDPLGVARAVGVESGGQLAQPGVSASVSFTRPNDTNAYTAGDVIGPATAAGGAILEFDFKDKNGNAFGGGELMITTAALRQAVSSIPSGETSFRVYLYGPAPNGAGQSNLGDNAAWTLGSSDYPAFLDNYVDLGTPVVVGGTGLVKTDGINTQITVPNDGKVRAYLVTNGTYTPAAQTAWQIDLHGTPV